MKNERIAALESRLAAAEARIAILETTTDDVVSAINPALASTQFAGAGLTINLYDVDPDDDLPGAVGWAIKRDQPLRPSGSASA
jgi:uncharacterized coiled-coil protein SlyX